MEAENKLQNKFFVKKNIKLKDSKLIFTKKPKLFVRYRAIKIAKFF